MKRIVAMLLALMMVMTGTLALAEETAEAAPFAITLTDEVEIDREAAKQLMTTYGVAEDQIAVFDAVFSLLNAMGHKLVFADNGLQYDLSMGGKDALTLAGEVTDDGISIVSTLFPNYALTVNSQTVLDLLEKAMTATNSTAAVTELPAEAAEALQEYGEAFIAKVTPALTIGEAENEEFTLDEYTFNGKIPMEVDTRTIAEAFKEMIEKALADERVAPVLESMKASGVNFNAEDLKLPDDFAETVPDIKLDYYYAQDDQGNQTSDCFIDAELIRQGETETFMTVSVLFVEGRVQIIAVVPETQLQCQVDITYNEAGCNIEFDVYNQDQLVFGLNVNIALGEDIVIVSDLYVSDEENPLAHETTVISMNGQRTMAVTLEDKIPVAVEDLMNSEDGSAASGIGMDILLNGLGDLLSVTTEAAPELNDLMGMFTGASNSAA